MSDNDKNAAPMVWGISRPIAILFSLGLLIAIGVIGVLFFATKTIDGRRIVYDIKRSELSDDRIVDAVERRAYASTGLNCDVAVIDDGKRLQIDLPSGDAELVSFLGSLLRAKGELRFLPLADPVNHAAISQAARKAASSGDLTRDVNDDSGQRIGRWVSIDQTENPATGWPVLRCSVDGVTTRNSETGEIVDLNAEIAIPADENEVGKWMVDNGVAGMDVLSVIEPAVEVGSDQLSYVSMTFDEVGNPAIALEFTDAGGDAMFTLTSLYAPMGNRLHRLGIVVDDRLLSAPNILQPIRKSARITGDFTGRELNGLIQLLKVGHLPVDLSEAPVFTRPIKMKKRFIDF